MPPRPSRATLFPYTTLFRSVQDWIGTVETVDANGEGKAVVVISIEDDIELGTWNNAFSDISDNTLIEQGDPLYDAALEIATGDTVRLSGTLKHSSEGHDACYYTSNLTEVMSIESPDYIMNFSDLQKIERSIGDSSRTGRGATPRPVLAPPS